MRYLRLFKKTICNSVLYIRTMQEEGLEVIWQLGDAQLVFRRKTNSKIVRAQPTPQKGQDLNKKIRADSGHVFPYIVFIRPLIPVKRRCKQMMH